MVELSELKTALRLEPDQTAEDDYIVGLEVAAVAHVQNVTGNSYTAGEDTVVYLFGTGTAQLWVTALFTTPTILERAYPGAVTTTAITDFVVRDGYLLRTGGYVWTTGYEYEVTGDTGYAVDGEPADVRQAVIQLVSHWFEYRTPVVAGMSVADVPYSVSELLGPHRRLPIA